MGFQLPCLSARISPPYQDVRGNKLAKDEEPSLEGGPGREGGQNPGGRAGRAGRPAIDLEGGSRREGRWIW